MKASKFIPTPLVASYERKPLELVEATKPGWSRLVSSLADLFTITMLLLSIRGRPKDVVGGARPDPARLSSLEVGSGSRSANCSRLAEMRFRLNSVMSSKACKIVSEDSPSSKRGEPSKKDLETGRSRACSAYSSKGQSPQHRSDRFTARRLSDNRVWVAVKVQAACSSKTLSKRDLRLVRFLMRILNWLDASKRICGWIEMYEELDRMLTEELRVSHRGRLACSHVSDR